MISLPPRRYLLVVLLLGLASCHSQPRSASDTDSASARAGTSARVAVAGRGMVATVHPLATRAGLDALARGGNAVDAAVAAALTLGVVDGFNSGIGGGCFILIRTADGRFTAIDGRETAPARATRDMFVRDGRADTELSQAGPLAVGTPGALSAYARAIERHGRLKLADLLLPAADLAERGFAIDGHYAAKLSQGAPKLFRIGGAAAVFDPDGDSIALREGETLIQRDLAQTYRAIAAGGPEVFYKGFVSEAIGKWMSENGGLLSRDDLASYQPKTRWPVVSTYRGCTVVGFPPPSSGGVHVAQILNILENFDLRALHDRDPALFTHVVSEAMKLAFADRAYWLGDPAFARVPRGLLDKGYARGLSRRINLDRVTPVDSHGQPPDVGDFTAEGRGRGDPTGEADRVRTQQRAPTGSLLLCGEPELARHTTHIAAADAEGNWVAITATINTTFGSGIIVPGTGVVLNNEMDDFAIAPGVANAFGLVGSEANSVAPDKRPLSSMSPTIVLRDGSPVLTVGAAGGPRIISQVLLTILRTIDLGMPIDSAVAAPRFHHQWIPDAVYVESTVDDPTRTGLERRGHTLKSMDQAGVTQAIGYDAKSRLFTGVSDPRVGGRAAGR